MYQLLAYMIFFFFFCDLIKKRVVVPPDKEQKKKHLNAIEILLKPSIFVKLVKLCLAQFYYCSFCNDLQ